MSDVTSKTLPQRWANVLSKVLDKAGLSCRTPGKHPHVGTPRGGLVDEQE